MDIAADFDGADVEDSCIRATFFEIENSLDSIEPIRDARTEKADLGCKE